MKFTLLIAFVFTTGVIASVNGLKCYQCTSTVTNGVVVGDEKCKSGELNAESLLDCPANANEACTSTAGSSTLPSSETYIRACSLKIEGFENTCIEEDVAGMKAIVCICDTEGCNKDALELPCEGDNFNTTVDPGNSSSANPCEGDSCNTTVDPGNSSSAKPCEGDSCSSSSNIKVTFALFLAIPALVAKYYF